MKQWKTLSGSTAMILALGGMAQADVTAAEVWSNYKSIYSEMGMSMTAGSETMSVGTLTVRDLAIDMTAPDVSVNGTIGMMAFKENGDGTVTITSSDSYVMTVTGPDADFSAEMTISQPGVSILASGDARAVTYVFDAPKIGIDVTSLIVEDTKIDGDILIGGNDISGTYVVTESEIKTLTSDIKAGSVNVTMAMQEPDGDGMFNMTVNMADLNATSEGHLGLMGASDDMAAMLASGLTTDARITHGPASYKIDFAADNETFDFAGQAGSGHIDVGLDEAALRYDVGTKGFSFTMSGSEIPLPEIAAKFGELGLAFLMPVGKSEEPEDFAFKLTMDNMSISEMIWGMLDPGGALPHDPATLILDLAGTAKLFFNLMDPESAEAMTNEVPGELHSLDINAVNLAVAGAELTGNGGFTFDNSDMVTFDGLPAPTGTLDLKLVGANALIDALVSMGIVPQDQAMGARMMMGLFARPGDGEDTLVSTIEVKGDGSISANGQRLQ